MAREPLPNEARSKERQPPPSLPGAEESERLLLFRRLRKDLTSFHVITLELVFSKP